MPACHFSFVAFNTSFGVLCLFGVPVLFHWLARLADICHLPNMASAKPVGLDSLAGTNGCFAATVDTQSLPAPFRVRFVLFGF
jgi:hypothetical protein